MTTRAPRANAQWETFDGAQRELRDKARSSLGIEGDDRIEPFRDLVREHHLSYYPLVALGLLFVADQFQSYAFTVLTPEISRTLGISIAAIGAARSLQALAMAVAPLPIAALSQHRQRRAMLCIITGLAWSLLTFYTGLVTSLLGLITMLCVDGLTTGSVVALHAPLVVDSYHPAARVRALSLYNAIGSLGLVAAPLLVGGLAGWLGFTWRGVFVCLGGTSFLLALASLGLRDPGPSKWDTEGLSTASGETSGLPHRSDLALGFWEICRRVSLIPTNRRVFAGFAMYGMLTVPLGTFVSFFLDERWNLGPGARGLFFAFYGGCGVVGLLLYGERGERQFRQSPARVLRASGVMLGVAVALIAVSGGMPWFVPMLACVGLAGAAISILQPLLAIALLSIVPAPMRPHAQAVAGIFMAIGGLAGALLLGSVEDQFGITGTLIAIAIPGVIGAGIVASAGGLIEADLDRMIDEAIEADEIDRIATSGGRLPMVACRGISFSYGQMQVLFGIDFTVEDGEMVALLGTNGAGKSTLLRVISGVGLPDRGSVRLRGHDITFLDAERRLRLGITQIPGGHATFGQLTVVENVRSFGYSLARNRQTLNRAIDTAFDAFPRLAERRNAPAATLSGGEQQMLALTKALILRPQLLLIDELSLGLAPVVVAQLLDMVRHLNAEGSAVVLVEQSVNVALNLVQHAYFMEKGEIRFDGAAHELVGRDDLLRAVFLHGAPSEAAI